jgi:hypothetical protein
VLFGRMNDGRLLNGRTLKVFFFVFSLKDQMRALIFIVQFPSFILSKCVAREAFFKRRANLKCTFQQNTIFFIF